MKKRWQYLLAPVATAALILQIYYNYHLYPFGSQSIAWCDMKQQVIPILLDFKNILSGQSDMFLNLANAGGMSFWGVFLFFISSPFSFLVAFVGKADIFLFVNVLVLLKMSVCALTASIFFGRQFKNLSIMQNMALSVMYAFCGYTMLYFQNIVWLDMMWIFPILLISVDMLVEQGKIWLFVIIFSATITINFYLSYMVVLFLILMIGVYVFRLSDREKRGKTILLLCIAVFLVVLITAVIWLPSLVQYLNSARTVGLISSLGSGSLVANIYTTLMTVICSGALLAVIPMLPVFWDADNKKETTVAILYILMLIPLMIEPINKMWHTGSYQSFPTRYGYITVFLGLILLAVFISKINLENDQLKKKSNLIDTMILTVGFGAVAIIAKWLLSSDYKELSVYTKTLWENKQSFSLFIIFAVVAALIYLFLVMAYKNRRINSRIFSVLLCIMVICESIFYGSVFFGSAAGSVDFYKPLMQLSGQIHDDSLYRVKNNKKYFDVNLIGSLGYNSLNHYTSLTGKDYMYAMKKLGYSSYWMEVNSCGGTEFSDALLANKYSIVRNNEIFDTSEINSSLYSNNTYSILKNEYSLPFGIIMNAKNINDIQELPNEPRMDIQQNVFQSMFSTKSELVTHYNFTDSKNIRFSNYDSINVINREVSEQAGTISYVISVQGTQTLYFDCFDKLTNHLTEPINGTFNIYVNGESIETSYPKKNDNGLLNLGTFTDETVDIEVNVLKDVCAQSFGVSGINLNTLKTAISQAHTANLKQSGNTIIGTAKANGEGQYLFLPLPYDDGYSITVNDQQCKIYRVYDAFMAVKLNNGNNTIKISYTPVGFKTGVFFSVIGVLLFCAILILLRRGLYEKIKFLSFPATILFLLLFIAVFIIVYIFPVFIYFGAG